MEKGNKTFKTNNTLVVFLSILQMRHLTGSEMEEIILEAENLASETTEINPYTMGFHAKHLANRLLMETKEK